LAENWKLETGCNVMDCRLIQVGSDGDEVFPLKEGVTNIGRDSDNDIQFMFESVSRHHARINNMPYVCEIEDLGSTNGTSVNGGAITRYDLRHGDEIGLGSCMLRFEETQADETDDVAVAPREYSERSRHATVLIQLHPDEEFLDHRGGKGKTQPIPHLKPLPPE
jgi:predicted component of type VI protein secretion system